MSQEFIKLVEKNISGQTGDSNHWTLETSAHWKERLPKWKTAWVHYEADFNKLRSAIYLIQRVQGESNAQFKERLDTADYLPLFGTIIDSLVGRLNSVEPIKRRWQMDESPAGLGRPSELSSHSHELWDDIDGQGTNYLTMMEDLAIRTMVFNEMWVYVKGVERDDRGRIISGPKIQLIEPAAITNVKFDSNGSPLEVLMKGWNDTQQSLKQKSQRYDTYTLFTVDGTVLIEHIPDEDGNINIVESPLEPYGTEEKSFHFYTTSKAVKNRLPIFRVKLPLKRYVGYTLAEKNGVIFNQESERDNILRIACTPLFIFAGNDDAFESAAIAREQGWNALQLDPQSSRQHYYASPDTDAATLRTSVLRDKIADFFISSFKFYEDSVKGKQKTATEISQDSAAGEGSFLNSLANTIDEAENTMMFLVEQILFPINPTAWGQFKCDRPKDFSPINPSVAGRETAETFFGANPVPLGDSGLLNAVRAIADSRGIEFNDSEALADIQVWKESRIQENRPVPPPTGPDPVPAPPVSTNS
tara:strand:- start:4334 stop:5926 length:1593 start_codon:yes stop_codon:yes gene_type:complete